MNMIERKRCSLHSQREAVAQCLECQNYFCRECVTEHDDRVLCSGCLDRVAEERFTRKKGFRFIRGTVSFFTGLIIVWFFFYMVGSTLLKLPASFHEGTLWQDLW